MTISIEFDPSPCPLNHTSLLPVHSSLLLYICILNNSLCLLLPQKYEYQLEK